MRERLRGWWRAKREANRAMEARIRDQYGPQSIYCTDDYPREGCTVAVDVQKKRYVMAIFGPAGQRLEEYSCRTAAGLSRMLEDWCAGRVPRPAHLADQSPSALIS